MRQNPLTLEQLIEDLTRGNVTEVKVVLASVVLALAAYQLLLAGVVYGRVRLPFLSPEAAAWTHRATGRVIVVLVAVVATMCLAFYGFEEGGIHAVAGLVVLGVLAVKVLVVRLGRLGRLLPVLGVSLAALLTIVWLTSAGDFLGVSG
ncbi:MAG TPA: DUF6529 family protein [Solirubrobacterales bacterium]|nr:DUF6529 family protein [Solirubrobacterales bacterium]